MDYKSIYKNLIDTRRNRIIDSDTYYELHHILPKCLGGKNDKSNLICLTAKEHIFAHLLLSKIYPENLKIAFALNAMLNLINDSSREREVAMKTFSIRTQSYFREHYKRTLSLGGVIDKSGKVRFKKKTVICLSTKDNRIIRIYSPMSLCEIDGFTRSSVSKAVLSNSTYAGYKWIYLDNNNEDFYRKSIREYLTNSSKGIFPELNSEFFSFKVNERSWRMSNLKLKGTRVTEERRQALREFNKGRIVSDSAIEKRRETIKRSKIQGIYRNGRSRKVKDLSTGKIYDTIEDCAKSFNVIRDTITNWIKKGKNNLVFLKQKIIAPNGNVYDSISACSRGEGYSKPTIKRWIENYPEFGYRQITYY